MFLALLTLIAAQANTAAEPAEPDPSFSERLFWAGVDATGNKLCDRRQAARYRAAFTRRYGTRIRRLMAIHTARFGPDPAFPVVSDCHRWRGTSRAQDQRHRAAMDAFEAWLRDAERNIAPR